MDAMMGDAGAAHNRQEPKAKVFISYSRKDMAFADRLDVALKKRGFEPLIDRSDICVFEDWWQRIQNLIIQADTVIFVISPASVASHTCKKEVAFATSRNKRLAPVELLPVDNTIVPDALERINFDLFDDSESFENNVDRLAEALQVDIDWIRNHTRFGRRAHNWAAAGRPGGMLLRSPLLEQAEHWIASRPQDAPTPTPDTQAFISESRRMVSRQRDVLIASLAIGLVAAIGLAGLAFSASVRADSESARAKQALVTAEELANTLVLDFGRDPRIRSLSPDLLRKLFDLAIRGYDNLIMLDRSNPLIYDNRGNAYLEEKDLDDAIADYGRAIKLDPKYAMAYSDRCWARVLADKQLQEALSDCNNALAIQPNDAGALEDRAYAYLRLGRVDDAIADFDAAIAIKPEASSFYGRGLAKLKKKDQKGAQDDMATAATIRPTIAEELASYGIYPG